jgi:tetratricopeptide (TPR) repeat protein
MQHRTAILVSICASLCLAAPAQTALAQSDDAQGCGGATSAPQAWIAACSAIIASRSVDGEALAAAYAQRGYAYTLLRKLPEAEKDLDQAVKINPKSAMALVHRANFWNVSGKPERALADSELALRLDARMPLAFYTHAGAALNLKQYNRAIADYSEALRLRPASGADVYKLRGRAYYRNGDYKHAVADYDEQLKLDPKDVGTLLNRGDALRAMGEFARAGADYNMAVKLAPDNPGGFNGRGFIRLATQDFKGAVNDFDEAIHRGANESAIFVNRGAAWSALKENDKALADFNAAIKLEPAHPLAYVDRGQTLNDIGDRDGAIASVSKALELAPGFPPALDLRKKLGLDNPPKPKEPPAAASLDVTACVFPVSGSILERDSIDRVIAACTALIDAPGAGDDMRSQAYLQRGSMYRRLGKYELALTDFSLSIKYDPKSAPAYTGRGNAYRGMRQFDRAVADHSEAIRLDPNNPEAYNNRGNAWRDKDDNQQAVADYNAAIRLDPHYAIAFYNRGIARLDADDKDGGIADLREALKLNPNLRQAADALGQFGANQ